MRMLLGPEDRSRSMPAEMFLDRAIAAAARCGVTRLADITRLDRLGLPVWQAVRPAGKALSVHQGKGSSPLTARVGALCEAIECHCAENVPADGPLCPFADLPPDERAPDLADYAEYREAPPSADDPVQWCVARDVVTGRTHYLPHPLVSLDCTFGLPSPFDRESSGLGAGSDEGEALNVALLEIIERDALGAWERADLGLQMATALDPATIPFDWFKAWLERLGEQRIEFQAFDLTSDLSVPVFLCMISGEEEFGDAYRRFYGSAAHGDPQIALFKAFAEALQSRLTVIASVRDDILPSYYSSRAAAADVPECSERSGLEWAPIPPLEGGWVALAERLARQGYDQVVAKRLDDGLDLAVARVFVPGLGSTDRTRRVIP
jgi:ribosomal protein S12 methylthiotransferase accessory factor